MTDGDRIKRAREKSGLSLAAAGKRLGVTRQAVHQWENDTHYPSLRTARRIATAMGMSLSEMLKE